MSNNKTSNCGLGVRPSSGAATSLRLIALKYSSTRRRSELAAPGTGTLRRADFSPQQLTNGGASPTRTLADQSTLLRTKVRAPSQAFTLIEIMVVVAIIGILAAVIIPQFGSTTYDARAKAAMAHIQEYANALERFNVNMDRYPTTEEGLAALVDAPNGEDGKKWRGPYIDKVRPDPWGFPYKYLFPGTRHSSSYDLWSTGADGADGGEGQNADIGNWQ